MQDKLPEWKEIPGFGGRYKICEDSRIFDTHRRFEQKTYLHHTGYMTVSLSRADGARTSHQVHRLLALAFFGPAQRTTHVHHKNGNKLDNRLDNLEYVVRHKHYAIHGKEKSIAQSKLEGVSIYDVIESIVNDCAGCINPKRVLAKFNEKFPDTYDAQHVAVALRGLSNSGRIQRVAHGWYARWGNSDYVVPIERKQYVPVAAAVSYEDKNTIDELAAATGRTISETVRQLIERALNNA